MSNTTTNFGSPSSAIANIVVFDSTIVSLLVVYALHKNHPYIRVRGWEFSVCLVAICLLHYHVLAVGQYFNALGEFLPCALISWSVILVIPMLFLTFLLRSAHIFFRYHLELEKGNLKPAFFLRFRFLSSLRVNFLIYVVCIVITIIIAAAIKYSNPLPYDYAPSVACIIDLVPMNLAQFSIILLLFLIAVVSTWKVQDAFYIKTELILEVVYCLPVLILWMVNRYHTIFPFSSNYVVYSIIWWSLLCNFAFPVVMVHVDRFRTKKHLLQKARSVSKLTDADKLQEIVKDPNLFEKFKSICVRTWCVENLLFYKLVLDYKDTYTKSAPETRKEKASVITSTFITPGSDLEVNVDMCCREAIMKEVSSGTPSEGVFDEAFMVVSEMLSFGVLREFSMTKEFRERFPEPLAPPVDCAIGLEEIMEVGTQSK